MLSLNQEDGILFIVILQNLNSEENHYFTPQQQPDSKPQVALWILVLAFCILIARLFFLQIVQGPTYKEQVQENTTYILTQNAPRGIIYDREHRVLASNKQSASLVILPSVVLLRDVKSISHTLSLILGKNESEIEAKLKKLNKKDSRPFTLVTNLTLEQVAAIYENRFVLPGITVQQQSARFYPNGTILAHVLGYTGQISEKELEKNSERRLNDIVGKYGVEKLLDKDLRGENAYKRIRVNRYGQPIERVDLDDVAASRGRSGNDVTLTIDLDLQKLAEEKMKDLRGAIVITDLKTGEILALVSKPSFDPNVFTSKVSGDIWKQMNAQQTFLNRALSAYPPGSIWKPLVLLAALESKAVKPTEKFAVSGAYYLGRFRFGDWTSKTGIMNLQQALAWSRDTAFYQMAVRMTDKDITNWGKKLGAGQPTGIELPGESLGILPDEKWKSKNLKSGWYPGYTLNYSIGQGFLLLTPAQAVRLTAGIATGNKVPRIFLVKQVGNQLPKAPIFDTYQPTPEFLNVVRQGMLQCVDSGTCQATKIPGIQIAGKTGSAEVSFSKKTHGWFVSFAPYDNPEVAITIFTEAAGHGGSVAAPLAKGLYELYFSKYHGWKPPQASKSPLLAATPNPTANSTAAGETTPANAQAVNANPERNLD